MKKTKYCEMCKEKIKGEGIKTEYKLTFCSEVCKEEYEENVEVFDGEE